MQGALSLRTETKTSRETLTVGCLLAIGGAKVTAMRMIHYGKSAARLEVLDVVVEVHGTSFGHEVFQLLTWAVLRAFGCAFDTHIAKGSLGYGLAGRLRIHNISYV